MERTKNAHSLGMYHDGKVLSEAWILARWRRPTPRRQGPLANRCTDRALRHRSRLFHSDFRRTIRRHLSMLEALFNIR